MSNAKILVVDDSIMIRDMIKTALVSGGFSNIEEAKDGVEGLNKAKASKYDFILSDINMPKKNGFELIADLRKEPAYMKTPILILTTERGDDMKVKGKQVGATGWIVKPFVKEQLLKAVNTLMSRV